MSTTLVPPTCYVVRPRGESPRVFPTIARAAAELVMLGPTAATVSVAIGARARSLTQQELGELRLCVSAIRRPAPAAVAQPGPSGR
jgi:hypothetical protein